MKVKILLFLVIAICHANGINAQFYDSADDIRYYVMKEKGNEEYNDSFGVLIFNFDGKKAALLSGEHVYQVRDHLSSNPNYFEEKVETTNYNVIFVSSSLSQTIYKQGSTLFKFSKDRTTVFVEYGPGWESWNRTYKKVDKSFFKVGRSRIPNSTLHE